MQSTCSLDLFPGGFMEILLTLFTALVPNKLTKTKQLEGQSIKTIPGGHMVSGIAKVITIACLKGLAEVILGLDHNQALAYGVPIGAQKESQYEIKTEKQLTECDLAIARSKMHFQWNPDRPGILMLDYDPRTGQKTFIKDELVKILREAVPELKSVNMLWMPSGSSNIFNAETNEELQGISGQRLYIPVKHARDIKKFGEIIFKRLYLAGHGYIKIGSKGARLNRSLFDALVWSPERLDFASGAICLHPLVQRRNDYHIFDGEEEFLGLLTPLTDEENAEYQLLKQKLLKEAKPESEKIFEEYLDKAAQKLPEVDREAFKKRQRASHENCALYGDSTITVITPDGEEKDVSVQELLSNIRDYDKCRTLDPFAPEYGRGESVGILNLNSARPNLFLFNRQQTIYLHKLNEFGLPDEEIVRLATLSLGEYERCRNKVAKEMGVRTSFLDMVVESQRTPVEKEEASEHFLPEWDIPLHAAPVNPREIAEEILTLFSQFIVADKKQLEVMVMWCIATWFIEQTTVATRIIFTAPDKGCGKTVALTTMGLLCKKQLQAANISPSSFFRLVEQENPTIMLDEADTLSNNNKDMFRLLNAGHTKASATIIISEEVNGKRQPTAFRCFAFAALAGIKLEKKLPGPLLSRSIKIILRKKKPTEQVKKLRRASKERFKVLQSKLARLAQDCGEKFRKLEPDLGKLDNRDEDNWEPLLAVAELCGGDWPKNIMKTAVELSENADAESIEVKLLRDIRTVFKSRKTSRLATNALLADLCRLEEAPWSTFRRGEAMNPKQLAYRLEAFGIRSTQLGKNGTSKNLRGYKLTNFQDAFDRYLEETAGELDEMTPKPTNKSESSEDIMDLECKSERNHKDSNCKISDCVDD